MRLQTIQIVAGLASALAFVLGLFMLLGLAGLGWLAYSLIKTVLKRDRKAEPSARA
jgi:threonine/homoserine/homoserine lactone efflux protein